MTTPDETHEIDRDTAARMLSDAEGVRAKAHGGLDHGTEARIMGWTGAAMFVYVLTVLLLFTAPEGVGSADGVDSVIIVLLPFLAMTQLMQGARDGLRIVSVGSFRKPRVAVAMLGLVPFIVLMVLSVAGVEYPWWVAFVVAAAAAGPLAVGAALAARKAGGQRPAVSPAIPLTRYARRITLALGLAFGTVGAVTPYQWSALVVVVLMLGLIVLLAGFGSSWGLPSVGSEWGRSQWLSFGASFTMLFAATVVSVRTPWSGPLVAAIAGVLIAAPLVASAFAPGRRR